MNPHTLRSTRTGLLQEIAEEPGMRLDSNMPMGTGIISAYN